MAYPKEPQVQVISKGKANPSSPPPGWPAWGQGGTSWRKGGTTGAPWTPGQVPTAQSVRGCSTGRLIGGSGF